MLAPAPDLSIESARQLCDSGPGLSRRIAAQQASAAFRASPYRRQPQSPVPGLRPRWWPSEPGTLSRCCSGSTRTGIDGDDERRFAGVEQALDQQRARPAPGRMAQDPSAYIPGTAAGGVVHGRKERADALAHEPRHDQRLDSAATASHPATGRLRVRYLVARPRWPFCETALCARETFQRSGMTSTGRCACTTTADDTLPRSTDWTRDRPRAPTTIGSASSF